MSVRVLDSLSIGGNSSNEDRMGYTRFKSGVEAAWVLDGATGLSERPLIPGVASDAAWLAGATSELLASRDPTDLPVRTYFRDLITTLSDEFEKKVGRRKRMPAWAYPSVAVVWVRSRTGHLECAWQGDCVAVIKRVDTRQDGAPKRSTPVRTLGAAIEGVNRSRTIAASYALSALRQRRGRLNRPGGYWMLGLDPRAASMMTVRTFTLRHAVSVLLASDGLWRLVDQFHVYSAAELLDVALRNDLRELYRRLRNLEVADADCVKFPRAKAHDDVTAMTLAVAPDGLSTDDPKSPRVAHAT